MIFKVYKLDAVIMDYFLFFFFFFAYLYFLDFPGGASGKEPSC